MPLVSKFKLCRQIRRIKYEGIHLICFECGRYGQRIETCPDAPKVHSESYDPVHASAIDSDPVPHENSGHIQSEVTESFGP